jgi:hypothetical protein
MGSAKPATSMARHTLLPYLQIIAVILGHSSSCMPHCGICACLMDCSQHLSTALQDPDCLGVTPSTQQAPGSRHSKVQHTQWGETGLLLACRAAGAPGVTVSPLYQVCSACTAQLPNKHLQKC